MHTICMASDLALYTELPTLQNPKVVSYYTKIKTYSLVNPYEELFGEEIVDVDRFNI